MKKEILDYLNSINGKELSLSELAEALKKLKGFDENKFLEYLKSAKPQKEGAFKGFYKLKKPTVAMLKSKEPVSECNIGVLESLSDEMLELNKMLLSRGANVAKLYSMFFADKTYVEIQELMSGKAVGISNQFRFASRNGYKLDKQCFDEIYKHNLKQQKIMLKLDQKCFDDLLNTHLILMQAGCKLDDCHSENVLVTKKGFTVVDLDYDYLIEQQHRKNKNLLNMQTCVRNYLRTFTSACGYYNDLTTQQRLDLQNNNVLILEKTIKAIKNKGLTIDLDYYDKIFENMVGKDNMFRLKYLINKKNIKNK